MGFNNILFMNILVILLHICWLKTQDLSFFLVQNSHDSVRLSAAMSGYISHEYSRWPGANSGFRPPSPLVHVHFSPEPAAPPLAGCSSPPGLHSSACERPAQPGRWPESWVKTPERKRMMKHLEDVTKLPGWTDSACSWYGQGSRYLRSCSAQLFKRFTEQLTIMRLITTSSHTFW